MKRYKIMRYKLRKLKTKTYKFGRVNLKKPAAALLMAIGAVSVILFVPIWFWLILLVVLLLFSGYIAYRIYFC